MVEDLQKKFGAYRPGGDDPDPPQKPMSAEASKRAAKSLKRFLERKMPPLKSGRSGPSAGESD
jgi:hypothetical protein